jgi:hypothetical protein
LRLNLIEFMKKLLGLLSLTLALSAPSWAQTSNNDIAKTKNIVKPSRDFVMLQVSYDNWMNTPDYVKIGGIGRGFNAYLCYDFPINKSNFSFAGGLGIATNNVYFKDQLLILNSNSSSAVFQNVDTAVGQDLYQKSKYSTAYLEVPLELRFFGNKENRNKGFKAAIGLKVGLLVGAHTKNVNSLSGVSLVEKVNTRRYAETWRFSPTARIGWGNFSVFGAYSLTKLFKNNEGPAVNPYSIGICITGL